MKKISKAGFTLIELLIVVAIIAILAAIAVPNFLEAQTRAKVSRCKADLRTLATAIEAYAVDYNRYPFMAAPTSPFATTGSGAINGNSVWYGNVGPDGCVSSRFIRLTTPISYVTTVFMDPFIPPQVNRALNGNSTLTPPPPAAEYDTYDYVDAKSLSPGGGLTAASSTNPRAAAACSGAGWQVVGAGPDRINAFGGGILSTDNGNYTALCNQRGVDYDPTNGTLSVGDLVRIGSTGQLFTQRPAINRVTGKYNF